MSHVICFIDYCLPIMEEPVCELGPMFGAYRDIQYQKDVVPIFRKLILLWRCVRLSVY